MKNIYELKLHETAVVVNGISVTRVPSGWLYNGVFVPFADSGKFIDANGNYSELKKRLERAESKLEDYENQ